MRVTVVLRLEPADEEPALNDLAAKLQEPERPLFIGRKPCLPSRQLFGGFGDGDTALDALLKTPLGKPEDAPESVRLLWPANDGQADTTKVRTSRNSMLTDQRNWVSGLHGGGRAVCEGTASREEFPLKQEQQDGQQ